MTVTLDRTLCRANAFSLTPHSCTGHQCGRTQDHTGLHRCHMCGAWFNAPEPGRTPR